MNKDIEIKNKYLTVKELKEFLNNFDDDTIVCTSDLTFPDLKTNYYSISYISYKENESFIDNKNNKINNSFLVID